jgi:UTP--glucose-1-phosphate uridylyltransferase
MTPPVRKAVFPVAGLGTRFLPATKVLPKEMLVVVDKPLIQYAVEEAAAAGITEFIFVTSRGKTLVEDHFDHHEELFEALAGRGKLDELEIVRRVVPEGGTFAATRQAQPLGLGHAVWCARELVGNEPFAVILPDDMVKSTTPCLKQMTDAYADTGGNLVAVVDVPREQTGRYGILETGADDGVTGSLVEVKGLVEKPEPDDAPSTLSVLGRYILQPELFGHLERGERGAGGEIQLTDAMAKLIGSQPFHGLRFEGQRFDCGSKVGYVAANAAFALDTPGLSERISVELRGLLDNAGDPPARRQGN